MSQLYRNTAKIVLGTFIELITCECKNMGYLSHYYLWLIIQVEPSPITPFKALSGPSIYQQLFLFGNRDTDRSPCSNLIKTRLNFYTTLAKSYKHCKLTLNTSYKKKYVGQVEVKRNFLNKKEAELKYIKLIEHCHTSAVILMRFFLSFVNRLVIKGAYWYQIKIHRFEHTLPNETLKQLPFLRSGLLWSSLWSGRDHLWDNTLHRKTTVGFELPVGDLSVTQTTLDHWATKSQRISTLKYMEILLSSVTRSGRKQFVHNQNVTPTQISCSARQLNRAGMVLGSLDRQDKMFPSDHHASYHNPLESV